MTKTNKRTLTIVEMRNGLCTLQEIGDTFGITRERVRQILEAENCTTGRMPQRRRKDCTAGHVPHKAVAVAELEPTKRVFEMSVEELREEARRLRAIKSAHRATKRANMLSVIALWIKRKKKEQ